MVIFGKDYTNSLAIVQTGSVLISELAKTTSRVTGFTPSPGNFLAWYEIDGTLEAFKGEKGDKGDKGDTAKLYIHSLMGKFNTNTYYFYVLSSNAESLAGKNSVDVFNENKGKIIANYAIMTNSYYKGIDIFYNVALSSLVMEAITANNTLTYVQIDGTISTDTVTEV